MKYLCGISKKGFPALSSAATNEVRSLRPWQEEAYAKLILGKRIKLVAPTGSGKTTLACAVSAERISRGYKCLIVAPQTHIAAGFSYGQVLLSSGDLLKWKTDWEFMGTEMDNTIYNLCEWLQGSKSSYAITTVSTLVLAYRKLRFLGQLDPKFFATTLFIQDEAHHISAAGVDADLVSRDDTNGLGEFYAYLLSSTTADLMMVSATHFRGDGLPLFMEKAKDSFDTEHVYPFIEHWKCCGMDAFYSNCVGYDVDTALDTLVNVICSEPNEKHIVCLPPINLRFRKANPDWHTEFMSALVAKGLRVLDLVDSTDSVRSLNKKKLREDSDTYSSGGDSVLDVVVTCNLMREGTDWVPAARLHDLAPSQSTTRMVQTMGRLTRSDPRKKNIAYIMYFCNLPSASNSEEVREHVADRVNIGFAGMLTMDQMFEPAYISWERNGSNGVVTTLTLEDAIDECFEGNLPAVESAFISALSFLKKDPEGELTKTDVASAINMVIASTGFKGDTLLASKVLNAMYRIWDASEKKKVRTDPPIKVEFQGGSSSEIRNNGFDKTEAGTGLLSYETFTNTERFGDLKKVIEVIRGKRPDVMGLRMGTPQTDKERKRAVRKEKQLKQRKKQAPHLLSAEEKLLVGQGLEKEAD